MTPLRRFSSFALIAAALVLFPIVAFAQLVDPTVDPNAFTTQLLAAIQGGQWRVVVVLVAVGAIFLLRKLGTQIPGAVGTFLASNRGGALLALAFAVITGLGTALLGGTPITLKVVLDVLLLGFTAIGGWVGVRRILGMDAASTVNPQAAAALPPAPSSTAGVAGGLDPK